MLFTVSDKHVQFESSLKRNLIKNNTRDIHRACGEKSELQHGLPGLSYLASLGLPQELARCLPPGLSQPQTLAHHTYPRAGWSLTGLGGAWVLLGSRSSLALAGPPGNGRQERLSVLPCDTPPCSNLWVDPKGDLDGIPVSTQGESKPKRFTVSPQGWGWGTNMDPGF